jgi:hypothetical protein
MFLVRTQGFGMPIINHTCHVTHVSLKVLGIEVVQFHLVTPSLDLFILQYSLDPSYLPTKSQYHWMYLGIQNYLIIVYNTR